MQFSLVKDRAPFFCRLHMVSPTQAMEGNDYEIEEQELQHNLETEIPRFNFEIRKTHLMADSVELVLKLNKNWKRDKIVCKELCDGITNKLVLLEHDDQAVLIRTYGHNSNILIDRKRELLVSNF